MDNQLDSLIQPFKAVASPLQQFLNELYAKYKPVTDGAVADYIPELAKVDPDLFAISIVTVDGQVFEVGDLDQTFTIQSASKPFIHGLTLEDCGRDFVLSRVGVEPTGDSFNAIILDEQSGRPYNPMVNAGAIATAGLVRGANPTDKLNRVMEMFRRYAGRSLHVDMSVYTSERTTGHRNRAIAHLMLNFGMVDENLDEMLDLYFKQCSVMVNCHDLGVMAATLANNGRNPITGEQAIDSEYIKDLLSVMYTCGMYDYSGEWAYRVGLPAKSGVGGGIVAVVPKLLGI
ncbi:MAG TPA: glutaminase A, partial [Leptolyngbyaceae cyanobacterium M65_K2018_010]|nr:glutaminase A [Leptolyngbyaceae cyanobacterium M65_K2018_010]